MDKERQANDFKSKATVFEGKLQNLVEQLNTQKAENLIIKEERDDLKASYMEDFDKLKEDLSKKNDLLIQTKDEKIRFETSLINKGSEVVRLQMLFDREKGKY
jgi:hypothetical protein